MLLDSKNDGQKRLEEEKNKNNSILVDAIKGLDKEIKDLKENRNTVLKLIAKYQDNNKNYRGVLKIWKEFLSNLREYNGARFNGLVAMYEIMSEERQIELRNKLLAGEKILKEISSSIFI
jgi:flagellar basal body rod protein FlgF